MSKSQTLQNKLGEIKFRSKLALQFSGKKIVYPGEPSFKQNLSITRDRIKDYKRYFKSLPNDLTLEPYLEVGAGIGQGAMLLENQYKIHGFATDISFETLNLANHYKKGLGFKKIPIRICCDVLNLPFKSNSIPFVFCFETLHHFPDPKPVLAEIHRVLASGGYFYFNEEPVAQMINLNLWQRDRNLRWFEKILRSLIILHFISKIGKSEMENDILEESFSLKTWEHALDIFDNVEATLKAFPYGPSSIQIKTPKKGWLTPPLIKNIILQILGGGIEALCKKTEGDNTYYNNWFRRGDSDEGSHRLPAAKLLRARTAGGKRHWQDPKKPTSIYASASRWWRQDPEPQYSFLACPNCKHKPSLKYQKSTKTLFCPICKHNYKNKNGIFMLFSREQMTKLYTNF